MALDLISPSTCKGFHNTPRHSPLSYSLPPQSLLDTLYDLIGDHEYSFSIKEKIFKVVLMSFGRLSRRSMDPSCRLSTF